MVFLLMAVSDFAFYALLGEKWIPAAPLFSIFILITLTFPQKVVNANIIKIQGDSALYRNLSLLDTVLRIIALLVTMTYSFGNDCSWASGSCFHFSLHLHCVLWKEDRFFYKETVSNMVFDCVEAY